jgi:hypothetical protein
MAEQVGQKDALIIKCSSQRVLNQKRTYHGVAISFNISYICSYLFNSFYIFSSCEPDEICVSCAADFHGQVPLLLTHFGVAYPPDEATVRRIFGARAPPMRPLAEVGCMERMPEFQPSAYEPWNNWNGMGLEGLDSWPVGF